MNTFRTQLTLTERQKTT